MHMKKLLSIGFILLLITSMATVATADPWDTVVDDPTPAQALWVDPKNTTGLNIGDEFIVDVLINITAPTLPGGGTGLFGFEHKLFWNSTLLDAKSIQFHSPWPMPPALLIKNETGVWSGGVKDGLDYHWLSLTAVAGQTPFTGVTSVATIKFRVLWQPGEPEPDYCGVLDIQDEEYVDDTATPIALDTVVDGMYCLRSVPIPKPKVGVDPDYVLGVYGENFTVDVVIEPEHPLFSAKDLCGWEAKLSYNTTVLDALECTEGDWFKSFEGINGTYPICNINDTTGVIHMADMYLGAHTKPSGSGVLMTIKFNATSMYTVPPGVPPHLYPLDLLDVLLVNCASEPIDLYGVNDGEYEEPYKILGWALDCWTDPYRKMNEGNSYETPNTGEGISYKGDDGEWDITVDENGNWVWGDDDIIYTADCYEPQEFVKLWAKLTYNEWPEQNKIIAFEIYGPRNSYYNISIIRTAITDSDGIATINFTIPHPCENLEDVVFGKWVCYQSAQVKDPWNPDRFKKIEDIIMWDVGWKVELLEVTVEEPVWPCAELPITVLYKNIAQVPMYVVFTFTVFDTLLDPIGEFVIASVAEEGIYCNPSYGNFTVWIHIPKWCHVGPSAHVCVNAFTALPMQCGLPYCPEVCVHFTISLPP